MQGWTLRPALALRPGKLLLPRHYELIKGLFFPLGVGVGALYELEPNIDWWKVAVVFVTFELVVYQGRYLWNDLRGRASEASHPERERRSRIKIQTRTDQYVVVAVLLARVAVWLTVCLLLGGFEGWTLLISGSLVVILAVPYEAFRDHFDRAAVSDSRFGERRPSALERVFFIELGLGYAVRFCTGMVLGIYSIQLYLFAAGAVCLTALGAMFVTMTWVLEGTRHITDEAPGYLPALRDGKPHFAPLLVEAGLLPLSRRPAVDDVIAQDEGLDGRHVTRWDHQAVLAEPGSPLVTWNLAFGISLVGAVPLILICLGGPDDPPNPISVMTVMAMVGVVALVVVRRNVASALLVLIAATAVGAALWGLIDGWSDAWGAALIAAPGLVYLSFRRSSYDNLLPDVVTLLKSAAFAGFDKLVDLLAGSGRTTPTS
jgi:hypothetical protein